MSRNKTKKEIKEEKQVKEPITWIKGSFVECHRVIQNKLEDIFLIKLSSINTIVPLSGEKENCLFYTYKDCCYYTGVSSWELRKAIDSFIFQPEKHWESYGY